MYFTTLRLKRSTYHLPQQEIIVYEQDFYSFLLFLCQSFVNYSITEVLQPYFKDGKRQLI